MTQEWNAFATKLSSLDLLCVLQYFLFSSSTIYLHTGRCEAGVNSYMKFPSRKGGGVSNLPSAMQLVWGMGHFVNEVLRRLFLFVFAEITSERVICYYSCNDFPCIVVHWWSAYQLFQIWQWPGKMTTAPVESEWQVGNLWSSVEIWLLFQWLTIHVLNAVVELSTSGWCAFLGFPPKADVLIYKLPNVA